MARRHISSVDLFEFGDDVEAMPLENIKTSLAKHGLSTDGSAETLRDRWIKFAWHEIEAILARDSKEPRDGAGNSIVDTKRCWNGSRPKDESPVLYDPGVDPPPGACFKCWSTQHNKRDCNERRWEFCINCGRKGVRVYQCARCKDDYTRLHGEKAPDADKQSLLSPGNPGMSSPRPAMPPPPTAEAQIATREVEGPEITQLGWPFPTEKEIAVLPHLTRPMQQQLLDLWTKRVNNYPARK